MGTKQALPPPLLAAVLLLCAGCGVKGPPRPPLSKAPEPVHGFSARQSGPSIELRWRPPLRRVNGESLTGPVTYEVRARAIDRGGAGGVPAKLAEDAFLKSSSILRVIEGNLRRGTKAPAASTATGGVVGKAVGGSAGSESPTPAKAASGSAASASPAPTKAVSGSVASAPGAPESAAAEPEEERVALGPEDFPGVRFTSARIALAVVVRDARGRRSRPGKIEEIDPVQSLPALETLAAVGTPEGVRLSWRLPTMAQRTRVNVYRREEVAGTSRRSPERLVPGSPFTGEEAVDRAAQLGKWYAYAARLVAEGTGKGLRESPPSPEARIDYEDRFPPGPPALVTATAEATGSQGIRIAWSPPIDPDISAYNVYRAEEAGDFRRVQQVPASETSWVDRPPAGQRTYRYYVTALDGAAPPNESDRSEVVEVWLSATQTGE